MQGSDEYSLSDNKLLRLFEDSENNIWIGSFYGGLILIPADETKKPLGRAKINCQRCPISKDKFSRNTVICNYRRQ